MTTANRITLLRLMVVPVFLLFVFLYTPEREGLRFAALAVYAVAALSDAADGYVARHWHQRSRLGARLDPLADKLIVNLGFVFIAANPHFDPDVPLWFPVLILTRDVVIVMGAYLINERIGPLKVNPRVSGKLTTIVQMSTLIGVLLAVPFLDYLIAATLILTLISMADYLYWGLKQAAARNAS